MIVNLPKLKIVWQRIFELNGFSSDSRVSSRKTIFFDPTTRNLIELRCRFWLYLSNFKSIANSSSWHSDCYLFYHHSFHYYSTNFAVHWSFWVLSQIITPKIQVLSKTFFFAHFPFLIYFILQIIFHLNSHLQEYWCNLPIFFLQKSLGYSLLTYLNAKRQLLMSKWRY